MSKHPPAMSRDEFRRLLTKLIAFMQENKQTEVRVMYEYTGRVGARIELTSKNGLSSWEISVLPGDVREFAE